MAEKYTVHSSIAATTERTTSARIVRQAGIWHRPQTLNFISDVLMLVAAVGLGWALVSWTLSAPLFPVKNVTVVTQVKHVTHDQVDMVARAMKGNFFTVKLDDVRDALKMLPWVKSAEVARSWPDGLEISIVEYQPVAYWRGLSGSDEKVQLITAEGDLFDASSDAPMPELVGPPGKEAEVLKHYVKYAELFAPLGARPVRLERSERDAWRMVLDNGLVIVLGREQEHSTPEERVRRFVATWPRLKNELGMEVASADLRYAGGFALTPKKPGHTPQPTGGN